MPNLSAQDQKFWISMKKGFIGRRSPFLQVRPPESTSEQCSTRYSNVDIKMFGFIQVVNIYVICTYKTKSIFDPELVGLKKGCMHFFKNY